MPRRVVLKALPLMAFLLLAPSFLSAQVSRYTVLYPSRITSGDYQGDYDLFAMSFFSDGLLSGDALNPKAVASQGFKEFDPVMIADGEGGYIVAYTVEHSDPEHIGDRDILMRRVNRSGQNTWGDSANSVLIVAQSKFVEQNPRIVELADRSLMILYEVHYGPTEAADVDIAAVRVARNGTMLWQNGVWVANSKRREKLKSAVSDGQGGAVAVLEAITHRDSAHSTGDVLAQHIDINGLVGWKDSSDPVVVAGSRHIERNATAVSDGDGGVIVAYELEYVGSEREGDIDILAQRINRVGMRMWTNEANPPLVSTNNKARERAPVMVRDSAGVVVAFEVSFKPDRAKDIVHVIGMQRLDTAGTPLWNGGKKSKLIGLRRDIAERPQILPDPVGGVYLMFEGSDSTTGNKDIYVQRVDSQGEQMWGDGEFPTAVLHSPDPEQNPVAVLDETGGLMVVASRKLSSEPVPGFNAIVAQRVALDGTLPWAAYTAPLVVVSSTYMNGKPVVIRE